MSLKPKQQSYKLIEIDLISFTLLPKPAHKFSKADVEFNIRQELQMDPVKEMVTAFTLIYFREAGKKEFMASIEVACAFELKNIKKLIKKDDVAKGSTISEELDTAMNRIAVATSRGILFSQLKGTYLHEYIMPLHPIE
ncbi:hypothetical protein [Pseudobacter ginsenosidimutans]|uniref:Uncharacterized protein n=1 Tax=Pseudobacter ginsenosidimutans TaxID=661488 RepID=A0A4Q7MP48_9BACT|nr:hypothetical protein [Pseudobacter ginsenosidimutans]QEC45685.1 hypothetical protein FSB84_29825 [Pseudobacter ginsenosidimutans]RZS69378.1 hypothetical protein EV199_5215 [Pseudobacter ginsenosidimutans]